ncbi:hypothetical protein BDU57DRAFT_25097 [Ampelomyces quisqualis]|uniref:Uncharacterized protein n=1 Tax=Ampelomyces quisqualis TaxID=50730 RepID=A0A6A5R0Y5_AMPQU|nr:hypothetical protein BDU57DRAFT_25097 [Ampelomyces quisqualis]
MPIYICTFAVLSPYDTGHWRPSHSHERCTDGTVAEWVTTSELLHIRMMLLPIFTTSSTLYSFLPSFCFLTLFELVNTSRVH